MNDTYVDPERFKKTLFRSSLIPLFVGLILSAIFSFLVMHLVNVLKWVDHTNEVLARTHSVQQLIVEGESSFRGHVITQDKALLEEYKRAQELIASEIKHLKSLSTDNPIQGIRMDRVMALFSSWTSYTQDVLNLKSAKEMSDLVNTRDGRRIMSEMDNIFNQIIRMEEDLLHQRNAEAKRTITLSISLIVFGSIVTGIFLAFFSRRQLVSITDSYSGALNKTAEQNRTLERQTWLKTLQLDLSQKISDNERIEVVAKTILDSVGNTTEAKVGALYLVNGSELVLSSTYAINEGKHKLSQRIQIGTTLLGQAIREKRMIHLNPAPEGYFKISSSMGDANPTSFIILPIIQSGSPIGVIELGFDKLVGKDENEVLDNLRESVANLLSSASYRERLQELLEQAQRHSEELQAQQEELRVVNAELEQQSRALKESHVRLENQQAEMEQTNQQLEEQTQELENQKNLLNDKNRELENKNDEIRRGSNYKSEFLANMSHELRTPLNSTLILAKLLSDNKIGNLTKEQVEYADIIYNSGNDLLNLINDILDLSKVEAGKMKVVAEVIQTESLVKSLEKMFAPMADQKKLDFKIHFAEATPAEIVTDKQRLEQILKNFLSNAFKFTERGGVNLHVFGDQEEISFAVSDTGIGMMAEEQKVIFEAFRQADGTTNRKFGGTGLGLSISKELAHLLGGEIVLTSIKGEGSTFTIKIPVNIAKKEITLKPKVIHTAPEVLATEKPEVIKTNFTFKDDRDNIHQFSRIMLIIEDDEQFAKVLFELAHEMKFGALVAETGEDGMFLAKKFRPNAIVLDIRLPDHSGMIVLDQLKMNTKTRHIPVHVISSQDFSRSALEMGAIGYMLKPVKKEQLLIAFQNMSSVLEQNFKHVLIVEDDKIQREHITDLITDSNVRVTAVETSGEALKLLSEKTFDCMIMDLNLPDLSGHELLSKLSSESSVYSFPPVIVYTARDLTPEEEEKLRLYSGSIIIKGAKSPERLLSEVTLFLHKVETELPPERQKMLKDLRSREKNLEERNILIVDDDVRNIFALTAALETQGAKIITARNGREALDKVGPSIDLVLMDIMMPEMDGYEAMRQLREIEDYKNLPILALTAKAMKDDKQKCLEAGANDYLSKPIEMDKLLSLIRVWLPHKRRFS